MKSGRKKKEKKEKEKKKKLRTNAIIAHAPSSLTLCPFHALGNYPFCLCGV